MAVNASELVVAGTGNVYVAAVSTAFPSTPSTSPSGSWTDIGYLTDDGVKITPSADVKKIMAWQATYPVRAVLTSRGLVVTMTFLQWNEVNLPLALGGGAITGSGPYTFTPDTTGTPTEKALLVRATDGSKKYDVQLARVMPVDLAEIGLVKTDAAGLQVGLEVLQPTSGSPYLIVADDSAFA